MGYKYFVRDSCDSPLENEYFEWAREQFGNIGPRWDANFQGYWFRDDQDATLFVLRWAGHPHLGELVVR